MAERSMNGPRELPRIRGPLAHYRELVADMEQLRSEMDRMWLELTDEERASLDAPEGV